MEERLRVCGIELKGSDAIVVVIDTNSNEVDIVNTGVQKIILGDSDSAEDVHTFKETFHSFIRNYNIERIGIKKRNTRGQFAGGAVSFKIEGIIQLCNDADVFLIAPATIAAKKRKKKINSPDSEKLSGYQSVAYEVACTLLELLRDD